MKPPPKQDKWIVHNEVGPAYQNTIDQSKSNLLDKTGPPTPQPDILVKVQAGQLVKSNKINIETNVKDDWE